MHNTANDISIIQKYEREIYDLRQLIEISRALNSTLDCETIIHAVLDMCLAQVQTLQAGIFLNGNDDYYRMVAGIHAFNTEEGMMIHKKSPVIESFQKYAGTITLNVPEQYFINNEMHKLYLMGCRLLVPLSTKGKLTGFLALGDKIGGGDYAASEKNFLLDIAGLAGIAVENSRLYERSTIDTMTGLKNHAYFRTKLTIEAERSLVSKSPLSLVMFDVDYFKKFNDCYGHQTGDRVLKIVSSILLKYTRKSDFAARYGGEEFCLVLLGADQSQAYEVAERIRMQIASEPLVLIEERNQEDHKKLTVTISAGIATLHPELDQDGINSLIERADCALYSSKASGRNCVTCFRTNDKGADKQ